MKQWKKEYVVLISNKRIREFKVPIILHGIRKFINQTPVYVGQNSQTPTQTNSININPVCHKAEPLWQIPVIEDNTASLSLRISWSLSSILFLGYYIESKA